MYCSQCGFNIVDDSKFCSRCGKQQAGQDALSAAGGIGQPTTTINSYFDDVPVATSKSSADNKNNFWWGLLCVFLPPIVGFILYFVWREKYPSRAKVCLWCGVVAIVINYFYLTL